MSWSSTGRPTGQTYTVTFSVPAAGFWQLDGSLTQGPGYGQERIDLDQSTSNVNLGGTATVPFDGYAPFVSIGNSDLGTEFLTAGSHTLTFTITGENPELGRLQVRPQLPHAEPDRPPGGGGPVVRDAVGGHARAAVPGRVAVV